MGRLVRAGAGVAGVACGVGTIAAIGWDLQSLAVVSPYPRQSRLGRAGA
jgi:hypothetical protein